MPIFDGIEKAKGRLKRPILTIGNFDGVHKGHLALFEIVKGKARDLKCDSAVLTFDPHPLKVLAPEKAPELLLTRDEKVELILRAGIDAVICQEFDREFAKMGAREFVQKILVETLRISEIVVGYDYGFGRNREGTIDLLKELGSKSGFNVYVLQPVNMNGKLVSSTAIRNFLKEGDVTSASLLLGRPYSLSGRVIKGKGRGKSILEIPTANLEVSDKLIPKKEIPTANLEVSDKLIPKKGV
ncbi:MAG: riboflavin biosynthesis protein RibF, partial [Desulfatiglandales bacterium]